jgi:5-methylcytosine-specific restriction endonuclease McrA
MIERRKPGRPTIDPMGIPGKSVCLRLPAGDYDQAYRKARTEGISVPELLRTALEIEFLINDGDTRPVGDLFRVVRARRQAEKDAIVAGQMENRPIRHARRQARLRAGFVETVRRSVVYSKHGGICGICELPVDRSDFQVDHIVPLAKGGQHSYANTQPAHPLCNARKHAQVGFSLNVSLGGHV